MARHPAAMQQKLRLALCALAALQAGSVSSGQRTRSPVERVVNLLTDLKTRIESDGKSEQQMYDKYACWCEKTTERKASAIEKAQAQLRALGQSMLKLKGKIATLEFEIQDLENQIKANEKSQAEATAIRQKQNADYVAETTEMKEVLTALEKAVIVLREGTKPNASDAEAEAGSFLQQRTTANAALQRVVDSIPITAALKPEQLSLLSSFVAAGGSAKYAPQSLTVQGILTDMYQTFATDLESATNVEATNNRNYEQFIHVQVKDLKMLQSVKAEKEDQKAEAEGLLADDTQSYDDTSAQMKTDIAFFDETKSACESKHSDWGLRKELRAEELAGINRALDILTSDDARDLFSKIKAGKEVRADESYDAGVPASLLQISGEASTAAPSAKAYASLKSSAARAHSLRLAALAVRVHEAKVGHFDAVLSAIDSMITTLKEEDAADISKRDQCISEYHKTDSRMANITWLIKRNTAEINRLENMIDKMEKEKQDTIDSIAEVDQEMQAMTSQRQAENGAFLSDKSDRQQVVNLLVDAKDALSAYYTNRSIELGPIQGAVKGLAFNQQGPDFDISADQAPDTVFSHKGHRSRESKGILQIMTMLIEDVTDEIRNAMKAEEQAQLEYEKQMAAAQAHRDQLDAKRVHLGEMIAKRTTEKGLEEQDKADNEGDLQTEKAYRESITPDCDWIMGAFSKRAARRVAEMEGLVQAKDFLAGYKPSAPASLLEGGHKREFDDAALSKIGFLGIRK